MKSFNLPPICFQLRFKLQILNLVNNNFVDVVDNTINLCQLDQLSRINPIVSGLMNALVKNSPVPIRCPLKKVILWDSYILRDI